jgi:hypothetical protein
MTREMLMRGIVRTFLNNIPGLTDLVNAKLQDVLSLDGRSITSVSESGRSTSFHIPSNMDPEEVHGLLERALGIMQTYDTTQLQNWLKTPPTTVTRGRYGRWWMGM